VDVKKAESYNNNREGQRTPPARDQGWTQGEVMPELVASSIPQYAVIKTCRTEGPSGSFVIAYPDEESLRDLIAGPSIIACGFAPRQEAQAKIDPDFRTAPFASELPRILGPGRRQAARRRRNHLVHR
jgi:hypothetical protein